MRFSTLIDITAIDYPSRKNRFEMVYHFLSMYTNMRIRLKLQALTTNLLAPEHAIKLV
ncbi:NADH-quinone oxidoreductase subunit C [Amylibacter sp.]|nr:NADH-quinone oxidoreductase subunit C [Amylibacter sp.]